MLPKHTRRGNINDCRSITVQTKGKGRVPDTLKRKGSKSKSKK